MCRAITAYHPRRSMSITCSGFPENSPRFCATANCFPPQQGGGEAMSEAKSDDYLWLFNGILIGILMVFRYTSEMTHQPEMFNCHKPAVLVDVFVGKHQASLSTRFRAPS